MTYLRCYHPKTGVKYKVKSTNVQTKRIMFNKIVQIPISSRDITSMKPEKLQKH